MGDNVISSIREALDMQTATVNELCERIRTLRQIEICALYLHATEEQNQKLQMESTRDVPTKV